MTKRTCVALLCTQMIDRRWCLCADHHRLCPRALVEPLVRAYNQYAPSTEQGPGFHVALAKLNAWIRADAEVNEGPRRSWDAVVREVRAKDEARSRTGS